MLQLHLFHALTMSNQCMPLSSVWCHLRLVCVQLAVAISNYGCDTIRPVLVGETPHQFNLPAKSSP